MALKMENLRLRLEFKNSDILSDEQRSLGFQKTWVLVPQLQTNFTTLAHLSAHILHKFHLNQSCPHGILLSMDGFALPPFVSISILKDKDVISVQKVGHLNIERSDTTDEIEGHKIMATDSVHTGTLLLANEEFDNESGGYGSEDSDDTSAKEHQEHNLEANDHSEDGNDIFKKRKASQKLQGSKKKKQRSEPHETLATENIEESEYIEIPYENEVPLGKKNTSKKGKPSKHKNRTTSGANNILDDKTKKDVESASILKINEQFQENAEDVDDATNVPGITQKRPSRSARRQYAKRTMLREMKKVWGKDSESPSKKVKKFKKGQNRAEKRVAPDQLQNEDTDQPKGLLHLKQFGGKYISKACSKPEEENQNQKTHGNTFKDVDTSNEFVPIEIRPRHIRFEALEEDQELQRSQVPTVRFNMLNHEDDRETFQWNGITSKKNGQKWGREKGSTSHKNDSEAKEAKLENIRASEWMDFANFPPLPGIPKEGDVIAYRLIELSSSWTPEISSYRVGKVSSYNSQSCKILLMSVPEYPIVSKKLEEDKPSSQQDDNIYSKDGSLEIDFTSLVDVRTVKNNGVNPSGSKEITKHADGGPLCHENIVTSMSLDSNENNTGSMVKVKEVVDPWEQLCKALDPKKEEVPMESSWDKITTESKKELSKESCWGKITTDSSWEKITTLSNQSGWGKITTSNNNWSYNANINNGSYRASRGSTLRPPMSNRGRGRGGGRGRGRGMTNGRNCWSQ